MKSITDIFIRHPVLAIVVNFAIVLIGLRAMVLLPIQQYPKLGKHLRCHYNLLHRSEC